MLLRGKTAIVTGCNRGIGKAIMEIFAKNGADIFACIRKESDEFMSLMNDIMKSTGVSITPVYFDFSDNEQIRQGLKKIISQKSQIDILVNNAGIAKGSIFQMTSLNEFKELFEINFFSQMVFTQGISRYMSRFKSGSIINIASTAGLIGDAGTITYGSSKAAFMFATKTIATELGGNNIRVNSIAPSITITDMYDQMDEKARSKLINASALKRPAEAYEIANVALFLASNLSTYITGQVIRVDGGITI